jgi:hypothetical protein
MLETREHLRYSIDLATVHANEQRTKAKVWYRQLQGHRQLLLLSAPIVRNQATILVSVMH